MDEIEYKLESTNPVLISHAISKLFDAIKKRSNEKQVDHVSKVPEFKLLLSKRDSANATLGISACQALIALAENGLWDIGEALSSFTSSLSTIKNYTVAAIAIRHLLILDLKRNEENKNTYPFTLHVPQHPFIMILNQSNDNWQCALNQMAFIVNHRDPRIKEHGIDMLRPVFLYILCNPSLDSWNYYVQQVWMLLIKSKHGTHLQREILLWLRTNEIHSCINTNCRIFELARKALLENNKAYCTALLPMIASLAIHQIQHGSDPSENFDTMSIIIDRCSPCIGNLILALMAEIISICPAIHLHNVLQLCITVKKKMLCSDIFLNVLKASILKWMAYPSILCSNALDTARDLIDEQFAKPVYTNNDDSMISSRIFLTFTHSNQHLQFYNEMVQCLTAWESNDTLLWLKNISRVPIDMKDKCKLLLSGLLLQTSDPQAVELCCNLLTDVCRETKSFGSHLLSLVLHKLTKSRSSAESKYLLSTVPELAIAKENVPIVTHTLDTLLNGDKGLKYFGIELYLKTLKREPRCYRFVSAAIIRTMANDRSWYSDATCARAMKYICENHPEHGEKLVPLLSQILNRSTDANGGTASALALESISALCKSSVIDICSTWRVLAPKMEKEKRAIVLESLCKLFSDVASYAPSHPIEDYDKSMDDIVSTLWLYATYNDVRVVEAAFKALACFSTEQIPLKALPAEFRRDLVLPASYASTPIDAARKPEDVLPYVPGTCWIQLLNKVNRMALPAAGDLLISFITREVTGFRSGIYLWPQGEPQNFKYLPEKSVIRAVGEYFRRTNKSDINNYRIITECLRIFAHRYPKPLPNINWSFLADTLHISAEAKEYALSIACYNAKISASAKSFVENYLLEYKSLTDTDFALRSREYFLLYSNLEDLCQAVQPNSIKPFLEMTLDYVIEKISFPNESFINFFQRIMSAYARALRNPEVYDTNSTLLATILDKLLDKIDLTSDRYEAYFTAALELSAKHLEKITSPKLWWDVTPSKLKNAIAIGARLAIKDRSESSLIWLNEMIEETASAPSVQSYFLRVIQRVQTEIRFEKSTENWILDFMTRIQELLTEASNDNSNKIQFFCDVLFAFIINVSGIDRILMKRDLLIKSHLVRTKLFPQALAILSERQHWNNSIPRIMEWLNSMRTSAVPDTYRSTFHRSLICLRHSPHYKDAWTKYLSIVTDADI